MDYPTGQPDTASSPPRFTSAGLSAAELNRHNISLLLETALITSAVIFAIKVFKASSVAIGDWLVVPCILVSAALIPTAIRKNKFSNIGFNRNRLGFTVRIVLWTCFILFPAVFLGCWLLNHWGLEWPLRPVLPVRLNWPAWLFYQFMYIAVAEEVFFRGYVLSNILSLTNRITAHRPGLHHWISIILSAAVFAVAHLLVQGGVMSLLTFLPGLVLGWLFIRTRTLLAPILFHGLANSFYCLLAAAFA